MRPNFFIVGAPKCGTTALAQYLGQHPEIFLRGKELHYFGRDLVLPNRPSLDAYLEHFRAAEEFPRRGEASVWYLYSHAAAAEIAEFAPDARIIIMLRNPTDVVYAVYYQHRWQGDEPAKSFEQAVRTPAHLRTGSTRSGTPPVDYLKIAQFASQVERYFVAFGRERVLVIIYDDFKRDSASVYREVLRFLNVDGSLRPDLTPINQNKTPRSRMLWQLTRFPPRGPLRAWRALPPSIRGPVRRFLEGANARVAPRPQMSPDIRALLSDHYRPTVEALSTLLGRDLSHWSNPREEHGRGPVSA